MSHSHSHAADANNPRMGLSILLTLAFVVGEAIAGYFAHSLALMSDAGHNFTDALAPHPFVVRHPGRQTPGQFGTDFRLSPRRHPGRFTAC